MEPSLGGYVGVCWVEREGKIGVQTETNAYVKMGGPKEHGEFQKPKYYSSVRLDYGIREGREKRLAGRLG